MDERFISPPGALKVTKKKYRVTDEDIQNAKESVEYARREMNLTPIDKNTLELIQARKKQHTNSSATAQH
jgi:hypothetical protein